MSLPTSAAAPQPSAGSRKCGIRPPIDGASSGLFEPGTTGFGTALSQDLSSTCSRVNTALRAPISELPRRRCRPNHGASRPSTMVSSHSEISASSTAVALRSTP